MANTFMTVNPRSMTALEECEKEIARYIGTRYAVICSSARKAIQFSLLALGVGFGDEVVIPDFACQILPITVFCTGAVPRFCDIDRRTLALSPACLPDALGPNTKAIIFVHLFGFPVDPSPILEITKKREIAFIDDAAQALGASVRGKKAGSFGDVGILTFNKSLDADLGGAVTTSDEELATKIKLIRAKFESRSFFASLGYRMIEHARSRKMMKMIFRGDNYLHKLLNVKLAKKHFQKIGSWMGPNPHVLELWRKHELTKTITNQLMTYGGTCYHGRKLERAEILHLMDEFMNLERSLYERRKMGRMYDELLKDWGFSKIIVLRNCVSSYLRYPILFFSRNELLKCISKLFQAGFVVNGRYRPLHKSPFFDYVNKKPKQFNESTYVSEHILPLPVLRTRRGIRLFEMNIEKIASIVNSSAKLSKQR